MRGKISELLRPSMMFYDEQGLFYSTLSENQSVLRTPDDIFSALVGRSKFEDDLVGVV